MMRAIRQALQHCTDERIWRRIQLNGMAKDFSWKGPAAEYAKVYEAARAAPRCRANRTKPNVCYDI